MASRRKLLHFITLRHPMAQAALDYWREKLDPSETFARVGVRADGIRPGEYYFFLFLFEAHGADKLIRLVPVVILPEEGDIYLELSRRLLHLIQTSAYKPEGGYAAIDQDDVEVSQRIALDYMAKKRIEMEQEILRSNEALVNARLEGVKQSYEAKARRIESTLIKVREARIRRMYEGQLRNLKARYEIKCQEIENLRQVSVSFSQALRGVVIVDGDV
jgi:hypothetical protein